MCIINSTSKPSVLKKTSSVLLPEFVIYITFTRSTLLFSYLFIFFAATNNPIFFIGLLVGVGRVVQSANRNASVTLPTNIQIIKIWDFAQIWGSLHKE